MAELAHLKLEKKPWPTRTHSLHYYYLALSEPGPSLPKFLAVGYVDDQPFIRFDSRVGKAEPQAPWMTPMDAQYWETETKKQEKWAEVQQVEMWTVMGYHNHSSGMHSTQRMFGCEIQEDGRYRGFWQFGYDGQDHLSLDLETLSWVSAEPVATRTKHWWETERCYAEYDKAYLEGPCLASLHRYLELGGQRFSRREPPTVRITKHSAKDGGTTLRCWALGFYPHDILLSWWLGEKKLDSEYVETRPSGDGTYQTWVAVWVPAGKKAQYTCHVQHSSLNHTLTVSWGEELGLGPERVGGEETKEWEALWLVQPYREECCTPIPAARTVPSWGAATTAEVLPPVPHLWKSPNVPTPRLHTTPRTLQIPQSGETTGPDFGKTPEREREGEGGDTPPTSSLVFSFPTARNKESYEQAPGSKKGVNWSEETWKHPSLHARFFDLTATQLRSELDPTRLLQTTPSSAAAVKIESSLPQRPLGRGAGSAREHQRSAAAVPTLLGPSGDGVS
eukprot:bmy_20583T0